VCVPPGLGGAFLPPTCDLQVPVPGAERCTANPYVMVPDSSKFVDQQTLKLQVCVCACVCSCVCVFVCVCVCACVHLACVGAWVQSLGNYQLWWVCLPTLPCPEPRAHCVCVCVCVCVHVCCMNHIGLPLTSLDNCVCVCVTRLREYELCVCVCVA
jgi:hypothetical protein